jgi:GST-like protein
MAPTAQNIFFLGNRMPERVPESAIKFYEDRLVTQFRAADEQLARTPYLAGGEITVADLGLYPIYAGRKALIDGADLKNVTAWGGRVGARPGVQKGMRLES